MLLSNLGAKSLIVACVAIAGSLYAFQQSPPESDPSSSETSPVLPRHEIVFSGHSDVGRRDYDVWRIAADGSQLASLVTLPGHQTSFAVSPDGLELAFGSKGMDGASDIWMRPFERGEPVNLTNHPASDHGPAFSPDGKQLAFLSNRDEDKPELYVMDLENRDIKRLTENQLHDSGVCWTPDGKHLLFTRFFPSEEGSSGDGEIMQLTIETGEEKQLSKLGGYNGGLDISPDGKTVAFHRVADEQVEIWLMDTDGANPRPITDTHLDEYSPAWSPDGRWIVYTAGRGSDGRGRFDLWLMTDTGEDQHIISKAANTQMEPAWRPGEFFTH